MIKLFCCLHFLVIGHWKVVIFYLIWWWINLLPIWNTSKLITRTIQSYFAWIICCGNNLFVPTICQSICQHKFSISCNMLQSFIISKYKIAAFWLIIKKMKIIILGFTSFAFIQFWFNIPQSSAICWNMSIFCSVAFLIFSILQKVNLSGIQLLFNTHTLRVKLYQLTLFQSLRPIFNKACPSSASSLLH